MFSLVFAISPTGYLWHHISNAIIMKIRITFTKEFQYNRNVGNHFICLFHLFKWLRYFLKIVELLPNGFQFPRIDVVICCIPSINVGNTNFSSLHYYDSHLVVNKAEASEVRRCAQNNNTGLRHSWARLWIQVWPTDTKDCSYLLHWSAS